MRITLLPSTAVDKATHLLTILQRGQDIYVDDIEVLDELVKMIPESIENDIIFQSGERSRDIDMIRILRFERGLDVRPK